MTTVNFTLAGIDAATADTLRGAGGVVYVVDEHPGFPCRQCLRDAEPGEEMILVSHDPFVGASPYRSASPIFLHRSPCTPHDASAVPDVLTRRKLSVRAFDAAEMMVDAVSIDGADVATAIERLLADPDVDVLHIHNEPRGCWAATARRA